MVGVLAVAARLVGAAPEAQHSTRTGAWIEAGSPLALARRGLRGDPVRMAIKHELSWSSSRASCFRTCRRQYYYSYYLPWGGWGRGAPPERRRAWLLKKMRRMPMEAGDIVHLAIQRWFEGRAAGQAMGEAEAVAWSVGELRRRYKESRDGAWKARPGKRCRLAEHHYAEPRINEGTGAAGTYGRRYVERIERSLATFFRSADLADVRAVEPSDYLACEEFSTFELFGEKIHAVPDIAYRNGAGGVEIVDWKTGEPRDSHRFQLAVYTFYAQDRWQADPTDVRCRAAYLERDVVTEHRFTQDDLDEAHAAIGASIDRMRQLHFDADAGTGDPSAFPKLAADDAGLAECGRCNFRELCGRP
jgi:hypothetical protein